MFGARERGRPRPQLEAEAHFDRLQKFLLAVEQDPVKFQVNIEVARMEVSPILDLRPGSGEVRGTVRHQLEKQRLQLEVRDTLRVAIQL